MRNVDLKRLAVKIKNTGFVLEHDTTELLLKHNWTVINNKYYIDDVREEAREIDIVGYKIDTPQDVQIYTVLIISCKKSNDHAWSFLVREKNMKDPNIDWHPIRLWTNDKTLEFMIGRENWKDKYLTELKEKDLYHNLFEPSAHIFAFQEIEKSRTLIHNNKNIFNSISSLMKAQSYELITLGGKKSTNAIYNFNLISVVDAELIALQFSGKTIKGKYIDEGKYVLNYIVNKEESPSRIHFINYYSLDRFLHHYNKLHEFNVEYYNNSYDSYFANSFKEPAYTKLYLEEFKHDLLNFILDQYSSSFNESVYIKTLQLNYVKDAEILHIEFNSANNIEDYLNSNENIMNFSKKLLQEKYHYSGKFKFSFSSLEGSTSG